jgi:hypothetical protein
MRPAPDLQTSSTAGNDGTSFAPHQAAGSIASGLKAGTAWRLKTL